MSLNSGVSTNTVKTALDEVFMQSYDGDQAPEEARASDSVIFQQESSDKSAEIMEVFAGVGKWETRAELQDVPSDNPSVDDQKTFTISNYAKSVDISKNFFDDDMHSTVSRMIKDMGEMARISQDDTAMSLFRNSFTTETTVDGQAWFSDSHTNRNGDTVDNLETGVLTEASLETLIISLREQLNQRGVVRGANPHCLLVPPALYKDASEILESELRSATADNDMNVYSAKYGIFLKQSPYLGAAAGGSDTAAFLLGRNHSAYRFVRQGIGTDLVSYEYQRNNAYIYKGEYRETLGALTYEGAVATNGTV
jgi:hypothetical protein